MKKNLEVMVGIGPEETPIIEESDAERRLQRETKESLGRMVLTTKEKERLHKIMKNRKESMQLKKA